MKIKLIFRIVSVLLVAAFFASACGASDKDTIKIGVNAEITGDKPKVGEQIKYATEMYVKEINDAGGIDVGGKNYKLELVIEDNNATAEGAAGVANKLISQDNVLAIVGPDPSNTAVPAGEVANNLETPMISPWSTNPNTTLNRPWVFRAPFLDPFQGPVVANFVTKQFNATTACVLFDIASDYPKGLADNFKDAWEKLHGAGSVLQFESFTTGDQDFSAQLTSIKSSGCEVLFTPQYYQEVPLIVSQAKDLGLDIPIIGSDSWGDPQLLALCGSDCEGAFFSTHYVANGATGATKDFIDKYNAAYNLIPGDVAALSWDSMMIVVQGIKNCGKITGNLSEDRKCIRDGMAEIKDFDGITGQMTFDEQGDPIKCAVIVQIQNGEFIAFDKACP